MSTANCTWHITCCTQNTPHKVHTTLILLVPSCVLIPHTSHHISHNICFATASQLAFDQYGKLSERFEQESAMRERAESMATEVGKVPPIQRPCLYLVASVCVYTCVHMTIHTNVPVRGKSHSTYYIHQKCRTLCMACAASHNSLPNMVVVYTVTSCYCVLCLWVTSFVLGKIISARVQNIVKKLHIEQLVNTLYTDQPSEQHTAPSQHQNEEGGQKRRWWAKGCT